MGPLHLGTKSLGGTIAESKLQAELRFALDDLELDIQRLARGLGVERPRRHGLKHAQVVDGIGAGGKGFVAGALSLVDGELAANGTFIDLLLPLMAI